MSFLALTLCTLSLADQKLVIPAYHMAKPPTIDGTIDEQSEWDKVPSFGGLIDSNTGQPVAEGGKFWLGYDEKFIYFAARLEDSSPGSIQSTEYRTNVDLHGNDTVSLEIDPFGHHSDENIFTMNASGGTTVQIAGGRAAKREWLGEILAKGRITETGWQVEARIPWKVMRLPHAGTHEVMFNVLRDHRRLQRQEAWQYVNGGHLENYGRWESPDIPKSVEKTIKLLPYGYLGGDHDNGLVANGGLDVRTPITDTLDFVGSANPDFRNVENGILALDASHFARQVAESRPFFLEGQQYFTTSMDEPLFSSQAIGRFDLGFKTVGKLDKVTDLGMLDAISYGSENAFAAKIKRQLAAHSRLEIAGTNLEQAGLRNTGSFLQFQQDFGQYTFFAQHETSSDTVFGSGHRYNTGFVTNAGGLTNDYEYVEVSDDFAPRLGFAPQTNYRGYSGSTDFYKPRKSGLLLDTDIGLNWHLFNTMSGDVYRRGYDYYAATTFRKDSFVIAVDQSYDRYQGHDDYVTNIEIARPRNNPYRYFDISSSFGTFGGERLRIGSLNTGYRPLKRLQLNATVRRLELGDTTQDQVIGSGNWDLGNDKAINGRIVKQGRDVNAYLAYKRSGNAGAEYFLILGDPNAARTRSSLILKVSWPLEIKRGK